MRQIDPRLLEILCCPITRRPLQEMQSDALDRVNVAIANGKIRNHGGMELREPLAGALVTTDGDLIYPIRNDRPVLFEEECIHWAAFNG